MGALVLVLVVLLIGVDLAERARVRRKARRINTQALDELCRQHRRWEDIELAALERERRERESAA